MNEDVIGHVDEEIHIDASPARVWRALVDAGERQAWWPQLELDAKPGGRFIERWNAPDGLQMVTDGVVVQVDDDELLRLDWADEHWPVSTEVTIRLSVEDDGTVVRVRHVGWYSLPNGEQLMMEHRAGWRMHLADLREHIESDTTPTADSAADADT